MKKAIAILCVVCLLFGLAACGLLDDRADKAMILRWVEENRDLLLSCIENNNFDGQNWNPPIQEINVHEDCIDFYCGGAGFGSQTSYCGFFYTESDDMYAIWCAPSRGTKLTPEGNGYLWKEKKGDNRYYVEKICDHFYYYDASF